MTQREVVWQVLPVTRCELAQYCLAVKRCQAGVAEPEQMDSS